MGEDVELEGEQADDDEDDEGQDLADGDEGVDDGGLADAAQDEHVEQPHDDRGDADGQGGVASAEARQEDAE